MKFTTYQIIAIITSIILWVIYFAPIPIHLFGYTGLAVVINIAFRIFGAYLGSSIAIELNRRQWLWALLCFINPAIFLLVAGLLEPAKKTKHKGVKGTADTDTAKYSSYEEA